MNKRKRLKGLVVFTPVIALGLSLLFTNFGINEFIFGITLLIVSGIGCAEALLGFHEKKDDRRYIKKRDGTWSEKK